MSYVSIIKRHHLIIRKLQSTPMDFESLKNYLENYLDDPDFSFTIRTFQRDIKEIEDIYKITIKYDKYIQKYKIVEDDEEITTFDKSSEKILQLLDFMYIQNKYELYGKYIDFDKSPIQGMHHLYDLLEAIRLRKIVTFNYYNLWEDKTKTRFVQPLGLKEFHQRWYLIGIETDSKKIKHFALERMTALEVTRSKFNYPKDFDLRKRFENVYGVTVNSDDKPVNIELEMAKTQAEYLRTFPLHPSQVIEKTDKPNWVRVKLKVCITYEFIMQILSYGDNAYVLKPKKLAEEIKDILKCTLGYYGN